MVCSNLEYPLRVRDEGVSGEVERGGVLAGAQRQQVGVQVHQERARVAIVRTINKDEATEKEESQCR